MSKLATWALIAFGIFYLATSPDGAAALVQHLAHGLEGIAHSLSSFLNGL